MKKVYLLLVLMCLGFAGYGQTCTATPNGINLGYVTVGSSSLPYSFLLNGSSLTGSSIVVTAPTGFVISLTSGSGYSSSLTLSYGGTTLPPTTIYVEFQPATYGAVAPNITITGGGLASPVNVLVVGTGAFPCSGTPAGGTAVVSPSSGNGTTSFALSLTGGGASAGGITYQWQSSAYSTFGFTNISGAVYPTYNFAGISATTYYRCIVTCSATGQSATSTVTQASLTPVAASCAVTNTGGICCGVGIAPLHFNGDAGTSIVDNNPVSGAYQDRTGALSATISMGRSYPFTIGSGSGSTMGVQVYIDFNGDGTFQTSESVGGGSYTSGSGSITITIPSTNVTPGVYRMRIVDDYACCGGTNYPSYPNIPACPTSIYSCEGRDYTVILQGPPCSGYPSAGTITATTAGACSAFSSNILYSTSSIASALTYQWYTSTDTIGIGWMQIGGATNPYYSTPSISTTTYYSLHLTCSTNGDTTVTATQPLVLLTNPTPITGSTPICMPIPSSFTSTPSGGSWSSSNTTVATIGLGSGIAAGSTSGATTLTYTLPDGCYVTRLVTSSPAPVAISGTRSVCQSASTAALFDASPGGVWTSSNTGVATVGSAGVGAGIVNGVTAGTTNIVYTLPSGCTAINSFTVNPNPVAISGPSTVCIGSSMTLSDVTTGGSWLSSSTNATVGLTSGYVTGEAAGGASIKYVLPTGCQVAKLVTVNSLPLPITASVTSLCVGSTTTLTDVGGGSWSSSNPSLATIGSGSGLVTGIAGGSPYLAYTLPNGCSTTLPLTINALPLATNVTVSNGGYYCSGGAGVHVGMSFSASSNDYTLYQVGGSSVVGPIAGTTSALDFGLVSAAGTYYATASNAVTGCTSNMIDTITIYPPVALPNAYTIMGGGTVCTGTGSDIYLDSSDIGVTYQLILDGTPIGLPVSGTGGFMDFGVQTGLGTYTATAVNGTTTCSSALNGSVSITTYPIVDVYSVTGGGNYCLGGTGSTVTLDSSDASIDYQLWLGGTMVNSVTSTGGAINFGLQTGVGTYTVKAIDPSSGCMASMRGNAVVGTYPLPTQFTMTGGGNYCSGTDGTHVGLAYSVVGYSYTLYANGIPAGTVLGSNSGLDFGLQSTTGTYTAYATNSTTGCSVEMSDSVMVGVNMLPTVFSVGGGGSYCAGGSGMDVNLTGGSDPGVKYQLWRNGTTPVGGPLTGAVIDFGNQTVGGVYTIQATNPSTSCTDMMAGSATIVVNPVPAVYNVTGGGNYCAGGAGSAIGLTGSQSTVSYQAYVGGGVSGSSVMGIGGGMTLGDYSTPGTYTIVGTLGSCSSTMNGSVLVGVNPLPAAYSVTGGGSFCAGGAGADVALANTNSSILYQLFIGGTPTGAAINGTGFPYDFGMRTIPGVYTVVGTNPATTCSVTMTGSATVNVNLLPTAYTITSPGSYCAGGSGVPVTLTSSDSFVVYKLIRGGTVVTSDTGNNGVLSFGNETVPGIYTAVGTNIYTGCMQNMSSSTTIVVNPTPTVFGVTGGGNYCAGSTTGVPVSLTGATPGIKYILSVGGTLDTVLATGTSLTFGNETTVGTYTASAWNPATNCTSNMTGSVAVAVTATVSPTVVIVNSGGDSVCSGSSITFTANQTNGGGSPMYSWKVNGVTVGGTSGSYTYVPANSDVIMVTMTSDAPCPMPAMVSNSKTMSVLSNQTPAVSINSTPGTNVCVGTTVTLGPSSIAYGGSAPTFNWIVNGNPAGTDSFYTYMPSNEDVVFCVMASNYPCLNATTVNSNNELFGVESAIKPIFIVNADPGTNINKGDNVIFSAEVAAAGSNSTFQWKVNGVNTATTSTYSSYTLKNGDTVSCTITSITSCGDSSTTHAVVMHVNALGVGTVSNGNASLTVVPNPNNGTFVVKGSLGLVTNEEVALEVTNMLGQVVYTGTTAASNGVIDQQVQLGNLANGMYILNVRAGEQVATFHFVIGQ